MNKASLKKFKALLLEQRTELLKKVQQTIEQDMTLATEDLPDEMDLASSEYLQSLTLRLRGRDQTLLEKINRAFAKIENNTFGSCELCKEPIALKRLEARPETTLCIDCKEEQERLEKHFS